MSDVNAWPIVGIETNERYDHSSGEPLPLTYAEIEYRRGWTDGRLGVRAPNTQDIYRHRAQRWYDAHRLSYRRQVELARADRDLAREREARARSEAARIGDDFVAAETERLGSPSSYSIVMGAVYCAVAVILWIADLPLSLLAADGLDIRTNYSQLADLTSIFQNWKSMWEPLAFSIGIAVLGLFFKFVSDFFFKPKLQRYLAMKLLSVVVVLGLIALVTWNLYSLARLRTDVKGLREAQRAAAASGTTFSDGGLTSRMHDNAATSFVLLTLTLPIIGGICASAGWSRIQNVIRFRALKQRSLQLFKDADEFQRQRLAADVAMSTAEEEQKTAEALSIDDIAAAAESLYEQGFVRGCLVPETIHNGRRLHERAQFAVKRVLAVSERQFTRSSALQEQSLGAGKVTVQ